MILTNPGSWPLKERAAAAAEVAPTKQEKQLLAVEHSIQLMHMVQMGYEVDNDELRGALRDLRSARVEMLKE